MMSYYYDERGWYTGEQLPGRDTDIEPPMLSETTTIGEMRANFTGRAWLTLPYFEPAPPPPFDRAAASLQIDDVVAAIYGRFTRFAIEYEDREAQAQAYKDAGYTGPVPPCVAEFATPAGMPAQAATDLILSQSVNLRTAQSALSALRMRKYEVLRAATDAQAQAVAEEILQAIAAVGAQVS